MKNKKIVHLITGLDVGGAETVLVKILPRMQERFDQSVCCIRGRGSMAKKIQALPTPLHFLDLRHWYDIRVIYRFYKIVCKANPDLLMTHLIHADLFGRILGKLFGIKNIVSCVVVKLIQKKYVPLLLLEKLTSPLVDRYICNSPVVADFYTSRLNIPKRKVSMIPNGIELDAYSYHVDIPKIKHELGIPSNRFVIGCMAQFRKQKNYPVLIRAFAQVRNTYPDAFLVLIGDGEQRVTIERLIAEYGIEKHVSLPGGTRTDVYEMLSAMDIFVLPSSYEGMSYALQQAMVSRIPCIVSNIPENTVLIQHGITGLVFENDNSQSLAHQILSLIRKDDLKRSIAASAKKEIEQHYDIRKTTAQLLKIIQTT